MLNLQETIEHPEAHPFYVYQIKEAWRQGIKDLVSGKSDVLLEAVKEYHRMQIDILFKPKPHGSHWLESSDKYPKAIAYMAPMQFVYHAIESVKD